MRDFLELIYNKQNTKWDYAGCQNIRSLSTLPAQFHKRILNYHTYHIISLFWKSLKYHKSFECIIFACGTTISIITTNNHEAFKKALFTPYLTVKEIVRP